MQDSNDKRRSTVLYALATLAEMYSASTLAKKLDADNDQTFETLVGT